MFVKVDVKCSTVSHLIFIALPNLKDISEPFPNSEVTNKMAFVQSPTFNPRFTLQLVDGCLGLKLTIVCFRLPDLT